MIRLLLLALGLIAGYTARRPPLCERTHLPRHRDPAIVDREDDDGILPPDPRTATTTPLTWTSGSMTLPTSRTWKSAPDLRIWPETLEHDDRPHVDGVWATDCPRCEAQRWAHSGARRA